MCWRRSRNCTRGRTVLMDYVEGEDMENVVSYLIGLGADVNAVDAEGKSVLDHAAGILVASACAGGFAVPRRLRHGV